MPDETTSPARSAETLTCKTCRWWQPPEPGVDAAVELRIDGACHHGPPVAVNKKMWGSGLHWPPSAPDGPRGWCGAHEPVGT